MSHLKAASSGGDGKLHHAASSGSLQAHHTQHGSAGSAAGLHQQNPSGGAHGGLHRSNTTVLGAGASDLIRVQHKAGKKEGEVLFSIVDADRDRAAESKGPCKQSGCERSADLEGYCLKHYYFYQSINLETSGSTNAPDTAGGAGGRKRAATTDQAKALSEQKENKSQAYQLVYVRRAACYVLPAIDRSRCDSLPRGVVFVCCDVLCSETLLTSEKAYVRGLKLVCRKFIAYLNGAVDLNVPILTTDEIKSKSCVRCDV